MTTDLDILDEIMFEVEEDDLPEETLPMETLKAPSGMTFASPFDLREGLELTEGAEGLFDFADTKLTPTQQMYIISYAVRGTKTGACKMAGVPYSAVDKWMKIDAFTNALQNAVQITGDMLEEELMKRAMEGSDKLLLEALKALRPEKFQKKTSADLNISGSVVHTWADLAKQAGMKEE